MADTTTTSSDNSSKFISDLPEKTSLMNSDLIPFDDGSQSYKVQLSTLISAIPGAVSVTESPDGQSVVVTLRDGSTVTITPHDSTKQDKLTFDSSPTSGSTNPVTSGGVYTAENTLNDKILAEADTARKAEESNANALTEEVSRAEKAEKANSESITTTNDNLTAEISRAKAAEKANADTVTAEASRAKAAEDALTKRTMYSIARNPTTGHMAIVYHA